MEKKQLDFNAPLLSVRRYSSKAASSEGEKTKRTEDSQRGIPYLPRYISDLKSGPISNAGEVPFTWEKIPGRPKDEGESKAPSLKRPSIAPKLPPGRNSEVKERSSANSEGKTTIRFQNANVPKHPNNFSSRTNVTALEISKDGMKKKDDSDSDSDSEDGDDAYADALDTLSRTESFFYNCSVSGVSGLDGPDAKPSGVFSSDPQTRDFMMGRFLPAAKAMASETPQYAPRRQPVTQEPSSEVKMVLNGDRRPTVYRYRPDIIPYVHDTVEEESDDEDDEFSDTGNLSTKACGLLPRFCLKSSLCLLSPVPGMKVRSRASLPSVRKVIEVKVAQSGSHSSSNDEGNWEAVYKHKLMTGVKPLEEESKLNTDSNRLTCSSDSQTPDGSSSHMGSGGGGISPYRNDTAQSPFHEGRGFLGIPKPVKSSKADCFDPYNNNRIICQGTLSHFNWKHGSYSSSPMVEKTLHVDSIHAVQSATSELVSSDTKGLKGRAETDAEVLTASKGTEDTSVTGSCPGDKNSLIVSTEGSLLQPKLLEAAPFDSRSSSNRSILSRHSMEGFRKVDGRDHESRALECPELTTCVDLMSYKQHVLTTDDKKNYSLSSLHSPLSPPLPKSPSESWLWRTLPSVSSRNGAQFHTKKQSIKMSSADPKWETMVKTSNMHHSRLRFSKDLSTPLSQISES